jgi:6-pyruvoyltetrahydropterin/6-carboxytetrahydropterin synthase
MSGSFEVGTAAGFRALHRIPWLPPPEGDLHMHEYRVEIVVERRSLDDRGMVCDLDLLESALGDATAALEGTDLDDIRPADTEAVTVEVLARWFHGRLERAVATAGGESLAVRVWESATAFGGYRGVVRSSE